MNTKYLLDCCYLSTAEHSRAQWAVSEHIHKLVEGLCTSVDVCVCIILVCKAGWGIKCIIVDMMLCIMHALAGWLLFVKA